MTTPRGAVLTLRWVGVMGVVIAVAVTSTGLATSLARTYATTTAAVEPGLRVLEVDIDSGTVEVVRGGGPAEVVRTTAGSWRPPRSGIERRGDRLQLTGSCQPDFLQTECYTNYRVTVPDEVELVLSSSTGRILVEGGSGAVSATTSAGRIQLTALNTEQVRAATSVGEVRLEFSAPPQSVVAQASTGAVEVVVPDDGAVYDVEASSSVGDRRVSVPVDSTSDRRITARTSVGAVEVRTVDATDP